MESQTLIELYRKHDGLESSIEDYRHLGGSVDLMEYTPVRWIKHNHYLLAEVVVDVDIIDGEPLGKEELLFVMVCLNKKHQVIKQNGFKSIEYLEAVEIFNVPGREDTVEKDSKFPVHIIDNLFYYPFTDQVLTGNQLSEFGLC